MNLHRADKADWQKQPADTWNVWQRLAARTNGLATPANLVSLIGALVVLDGLYWLVHGHTWFGAGLILLGRLADVLDGLIADITKTKSPLGEAIDATIDKIIIFITLIVLMQQQVVPFVIFLTILVISAYVSLLSLYARWQRRELHPTQAGKLSTAFAWVALPLYVLNGMSWLAAICFGLFLITSLTAALEYTKQAYRAKP